MFTKNHLADGTSKLFFTGKNFSENFPVNPREVRSKNKNIYFFFLSPKKWNIYFFLLVEMCWRVDDCVMCWCVDVLVIVWCVMCWCVGDRVMCSCVDECVEVLMSCWHCVDVLMLWFDVLMWVDSCATLQYPKSHKNSFNIKTAEN